jgi:hypothetical protein
MAGPGRSALPDWFKEKGPEALKHLAAVASGDEVDAKISRAMACLSMIERIYGKAPQAPEDSDAMERAWETMLSRLRGGTGP